MSATTNDTGDESAARTHFGFREVRAEDKAPLVRGVFDAVATRYDLMNDLMSAGVHRLWKRAMIDRISPRAGETFIDVAGGTGDIAFRLVERVGHTAAQENAVTVCDINGEMLRHGRDRALDRALVREIRWTCGDAQSLPFPDMSFDAYSIAFGLRNVTDIPRALAEARRVLKPGGRFVCLEFSRVAVPALEPLYDAYSFSVLPWLGKFVAGNAEAYRYLAESIRQFPDQKTLVGHLEAAGLAQVQFRNLSGGVAALHWGWRV